jgi:hypothetical protein
MSTEKCDSKISEDCRRLVEKGLLEIWDNDNSITSWTKFQNILIDLEKTTHLDSAKPGWMFRGEGDWCTDLMTSLEKDANQYSIELNDLYWSRVEQGIIRRFKREYYLHSNIPPANNDHIAWLAIMQHHGSPTRLLDITYSIYIGLYFSLWKYEPEKKAAIWCFNSNWLNDGWDKLAPSSYQREYNSDREGRYIALYDIVLKQKKPKVYVINPYNLPERLILQQGGFLLPLDITRTFMDNLLSMPKDPYGKNLSHKYKHRIIKIQISLSKENLKEVRYQLLRMNINNATLFPGLDGFARSLRDRMSFNEQVYGRKEGF